MAGVTRLTHKSKGYAALLKDPAVLADLVDRAQRIAEAAGGADESIYAASSGDQGGKKDKAGRFRNATGQFVDQSGLRRRARAAVVAPLGDPENRMLRALDAGR